MKKIKIEHLAPYLPFGVRAKFKTKMMLPGRKTAKIVDEIGTISVVYAHEDGGASITCYDTVNSTPDNFELLLKPSDYTKHEVDNMPYQHLVKLLKAHIDIFGMVYRLPIK
jgi:hypothetical protein